MSFPPQGDHGPQVITVSEHRHTTKVEPFPRNNPSTHTLRHQLVAAHVHYLARPLRYSLPLIVIPHPSLSPPSLNISESTLEPFISPLPPALIILIHAPQNGDVCFPPTRLRMDVPGLSAHLLSPPRHGNITNHRTCSYSSDSETYK